MAARYSKVERRVWRDDKVRSLSRSTPNARELWLYLLTCDSQDAFPGLYLMRPAVAADDLGWERADIVRLMAEIVRVGIAKYDEATSVVWLPNAPRKRVEELRNNPKNARGWRNAWDEMPECDLTREAFAAAVEALTDFADGDPNAPTVRAFAARPPRWLTQTKPADRSKEDEGDPADGSQDKSQDGSHPGSDQDKDKDKDKEQQDRVRAGAGAREEPAALASEIRRRLNLFPGATEADLSRWAADLRKDPDLHLPSGVSLAPYLRRALSGLADLVAATPTKPNKDRLAYVRRSALGLVNDDKPNGWASGRTDGREGVCGHAGRPLASAGHGQSHAGDFDAANAVREAEAEEERLRRQRAEQARRDGGAASLGQITQKLAAGGRS